MIQIYRSANKHGVADADIRHAVEHAVVIVQSDQALDRILYLGPDQAGNLLEVVGVARVKQPELVIHAMPMRRNYEHLLQAMGDADG